MYSFITITCINGKGEREHSVQGIYGEEYGYKGMGEKDAHDNGDLEKP